MSKTNFSEIMQDILVLLTRGQQRLLLDALKELPTRAWEQARLDSWLGELSGWKIQVADGFVISIAISEQEVHVHLNDIPCLLTKHSKDEFLAKIKELNNGGIAPTEEKAC